MLSIVRPSVAIALILTCAPSCVPAVDASATAADEPQAGALRSDPFVSIGDPFYDLGEVMPEERFERTFRFRNERQTPFELVRAYTSCGCTSYVIQGKRWSPGEEGSVSMVMDTDSSPGRMSSDLTILLQDDQGNRWMHAVQLTCSVTATEVLYAGSSTVDFQDLGSVPVTIHCRLLDETTALDGSKFSLPLRLEGSAEGLEVAEAQFQPGDSEGEFWAETVVSRGASRQAAKGTLRFLVHFEDGHGRELLLPYRGRAATQLRASQRSLYLGSVTAGDHWTKRLTVAGLQGGRGQLATSGQWVQAAWDGPSRELLVTVTVPQEQGVFQGWVEVLENRGASLRIPVVGMVQ